MSTDLVAKPEDKVTISQAWEKAMIENDLSALNSEERLSFVKHICETVGLNPSTKPFIYTEFNGQLKLYPAKGAAEQLRAIHGISCEIVKAERDEPNGIFWTHVKGTTKDRFDEDYGWAAIANLKGDVLGNAVGKAITKGKRRVTLSMVGLGWMLPDAEHEKEGTEFVDNPVDLQSALAAPVQAEEKPKKKRTRKKKEKKEEEFQTIEHPKVEVDVQEKVEEVKEVLKKEPEPEPEKVELEKTDPAPEVNAPDPQVNTPEVKPIPSDRLDQTMDLINKSKHIETLDYLEECAAVSVTLMKDL